ncbi:MAG: alcohol dehydrogenase catalytic domain-containing protein [Geminicoccaceae bacterium]
MLTATEGRRRTAHKAQGNAMATKMKAAIFIEPGRIVLGEKPMPEIGPNDALIRITTTTICGTDVHILKGGTRSKQGLTIGHEPVGVIEKLGRSVIGYTEGQRVIASAICPSGHSNACLDGLHSPGRAGHGARARLKPWAAGASATPSTVRRPVPGRARRHGQPRRRAGQTERRAGADVPGHHVDRPSPVPKPPTSGSATR